MGAGGNTEARKRKIDRNEGVSILRADREVFYGHVPYITGKKGEAKSDDKDRWWGCEISFPLNWIMTSRSGISSAAQSLRLI